MNGVDIWKIKPDGTGKKQLTDNGGNASPAWSPDGTTIAFVATLSGTTNRDIWMMDADGTDPKVLHANAANDIDPDWQQDSIPPNTTVTSGPPSITMSTAASLSFVSSESGSGFECSLDNATFSPCSSAKSYAGLVNGVHTFRVRPPMSRATWILPPQPSRGEWIPRGPAAGWSSTEGVPPPPAARLR